MHLGANGPLGAGFGGFDGFDDVGGGAGHVGFLDDVPGAFGVDDHFHAGVFGVYFVDVLGAEKGVDGAVAFPEDEFGGAELGFGVAAEVLARVPYDHLVEGVAHGVGGVAA